ncbi:MAG: hypothetical protein ACK5NT_02965 [Pyrinomonadaceae bacterium]
MSQQRNFAPKYLREDPIYNGGADKTHSFKDYDKTEFTHEGWATRRWDAGMQKRLPKLYATLGKAFDGKIKGINTEETSVGFGSGKLHSSGFRCERYKEATTENLAALKKATRLFKEVIKPSHADWLFRMGNIITSIQILTNV